MVHSDFPNNGSSEKPAKSRERRVKGIPSPPSVGVVEPWGNVKKLITAPKELVGGFNPFEKYAREIGSFPQGSGWK